MERSRETIRPPASLSLMLADPRIVNRGDRGSVRLPIARQDGMSRDFTGRVLYIPRMWTGRRSPNVSDQRKRAPGNASQALP
jgi:hypothetical protein